MGHFSETIYFLFACNSHKLCSLVSLSYWRLEKTNEKMFMKEWVVPFESDLQTNA